MREVLHGVPGEEVYRGHHGLLVPAQRVLWFPRHPPALITRWPTAPERVIYDFACALGPYCMTREPQFRYFSVYSRRSTSKYSICNWTLLMVIPVTGMPPI